MPSLNLGVKDFLRFFSLNAEMSASLKYGKLLFQRIVTENN